MALWTSRLASLSQPEFHLFDRDNPPPASAKYQAQADEINARERCKAVITGKKEMENYLHYEAINEVYMKVCNIELGLTGNFGDFDEVPLRVAEIVHGKSGSPTSWAKLKPDLRDKKVSRVKRVLNHEAAPLVSTERLNELDPDQHVMGWFQQMNQMIEP